MLGLSDKYISSLIKKIYNKEVTIYNLPEKLYKATAKELIKGVEEGSAGGSVELIKELKDNVYMFSAAKTYTQIKDISSLLNGGPYAEFAKAAMEKLTTYNVDYKDAEVQTAIGQTQTAVKWQQIVSEDDPDQLLQRKAVMDANTSPECVILNELVAPAKDPLWRTRSPLTHFRCRCIITQIDKYSGLKASSRTKIDKAITETDHINQIFKGNPGIDKVVFNSSHHYFDIDKKDKAYAKTNFGLPIPKTK